VVYVLILFYFNFILFKIDFRPDTAAQEIRGVATVVQQLKEENEELRKEVEVLRADLRYSDSNSVRIHKRGKRKVRKRKKEERMEEKKRGERKGEKEKRGERKEGREEEK
jgi:hypothetical protein